MKNLKKMLKCLKLPSLLLLLLPFHSTFSQSYPIQRIEGKDTVVVMTKAQAKAMNQKFVDLTNVNDELQSRAEMLDTLLVKEHKIAKENILGFGVALDSLRLLKYQFEISQKALFIQTDEIDRLKAALKKKPTYYPMTSTDVWMGTIFSIFGTLIILGQ